MNRIRSTFVIANSFFLERHCWNLLNSFHITESGPVRKFDRPEAPSLMELTMNIVTTAKIQVGSKEKLSPTMTVCEEERDLFCLSTVWCFSKLTVWNSNLNCSACTFKSLCNFYNVLLQCWWELKANSWRIRETVRWEKCSSSNTSSPWNTREI